MRDQVVSGAQKQLGKGVLIKRLSELDEVAEDQDVVVIGTLFKSQILKPNILKEVGEDNAASNQNVDKVILDKYIDESDELILEDELQRARLYFNKDITKHTVDELVTGVICGVLGRMIPSDQVEGGGKFRVVDIVYPDPIVQDVNPLEKNDRFVTFISGLELSSSTPSQCLGALQLAASWLIGEAGEMDDQEENSRIERLIIAGNSLSSETRDRKILSTAKYLTTGQEARSVDAVNILDDFLWNMASSLEVNIMPGCNDPANQNMPQQPLHRCLFPRNFKI
jgi:DNA polymerase delta subunit 2